MAVNVSVADTVPW